MAWRPSLSVWLILGYLAVTWYSLHMSASPATPCTPDNTNMCSYPLLSPGEVLSLELMIQEPFPGGDATAANERSNHQQHPRRGPRMIWKTIETCASPEMKIILPSTLSPKGDVPSFLRFDASRGNCTLLLDDFSRTRWSKTNDKNNVGGPLMAKFVLRRIPNTNINSPSDNMSTITDAVERGEVVAEAPFDLTRIVPQKTLTSRNGTEMMQVPYFKYRKQAVTLRLVSDYRPYGGGYPPYRADGVMLPVHPSNRFTHRPIVYVDDNALSHSSQIEMGPNATGRPPVSLVIQVSIISPVRDIVHSQVTMGLAAAESFLHESELDELRYFLRDEYLYRFVLTQIISFVHIWLDYLAFRDEIGFYRGKREFGGVSASSIVTRMVCSLIIFLYLMEGGGTSNVVLMSVGSGVAVDAWKAWKLFQPQFIPSHFPFVSFRKLSTFTSTEQKTRNFDRTAIAYLGLVLYPIVFGCALYARHHYSYKSWYSWLISNLANAVYTFGFIALCPQLYVNYRLKSVAHLPWKVFMYKLFNTFVDDVFAVLIEMPWKHRIMTLRDDVVFLIFLYQAYIYRVDKGRTNEFGYAYEEPTAKHSAIIPIVDDDSSLLKNEETKLVKQD